VEVGDDEDKEAVAGVVGQVGGREGAREGDVVRGDDGAGGTVQEVVTWSGVMR